MESFRQEARHLVLSSKFDIRWACKHSTVKPARRRGKQNQSWYLVSSEDKMIPPDAQRTMAKRAGCTVVGAKGCHAIYVSQAKAVADLIEKAAKSVTAK